MDHGVKSGSWERTIIVVHCRLAWRYLPNLAWPFDSWMVSSLPDAGQVRGKVALSNQHDLDITKSDFITHRLRWAVRWWRNSSKRRLVNQAFHPNDVDVTCFSTLSGCRLQRQISLSVRIEFSGCSVPETFSPMLNRAGVCAQLAMLCVYPITNKVSGSR